MKSYDQSFEINHNPDGPYIPNHPYKILIINGSGPRKTDVLLNLIKHQQADFDKLYLYVKYPLKSKYQLLINGKENIRIKTPKNRKAFIDYSQAVDDVYQNLEDYNPTKKKRVLTLFDDIIEDMESNKKLSH